MHMGYKMARTQDLKKNWGHKTFLKITVPYPGDSKHPGEYFRLPQQTFLYCVRHEKSCSAYATQISSSEYFRKNTRFATFQMVFEKQ